MPDFGVLTNRKRTVIALVHSVFFLLLAIWNTVTPSHAVGLVAALRSASHTGLRSAVAMAAIYFIVSAILLWLVSLSRSAVERAYFSFCATSASFGLLRALAGSRGLEVAQYIRVSMLMAAVVTGFFIVRMYDTSNVLVEVEGAD
jgi:hypothetical protein